MNIEVVEQPVKYTIPASMELEPLHQGSLDGLCGLYAIINAIRIAAYGYRRDTHSNNHALFIDGLSKLEEMDYLADYVSDGMNKTEFRALAKHLCKKASNSKIKLRYQSLPVRVPDMERQHNMIAALSAGFPVLVDLEHKHHYSVVTGFTPRTLTLFDSYGYNRTNLSPDRTRTAIAIVGIPVGTAANSA